MSLLFRCLLTISFEAAHTTDPRVFDCTWPPIPRFNDEKYNTKRVIKERQHNSEEISIFSNSNLLSVCFSFFMANDQEEHNSDKSSDIPTPEMFNMMKKMMDGLEALTIEVNKLKARPTGPIIPDVEKNPTSPRVQLRSASEPGGTSKGKDQMSPDQAAYDAYVEETQRKQGLSAPPPPNGEIPPGAQHFGYDGCTFRENNSRPITPNNANAFHANQFAGNNEKFRYPEGGRTAHYHGENSMQRREPEQDGIGKIKVKIPPFVGHCDPNAYMD